ncbi:calnexin isoform X2 [Oncorhynchus tshawytscha]|uniref:calnexin isoform X2 n=1 Tax=Oncorhynchus tshawytscha TaxID=74940 RepID=UPI001C3C21CF|nr:calnexin isoform X2 [Oncorhynchus tshawytscha]
MCMPRTHCHIHTALPAVSTHTLHCHTHTALPAVSTHTLHCHTHTALPAVSTHTLHCHTHTTLPAVSTHTALPAVSTHTALPAVSTHTALPAVITHTRHCHTHTTLPAVSTHTTLPAVSTHTALPAVSTHTRHCHTHTALPAVSTHTYVCTTHPHQLSLFQTTYYCVCVYRYEVRFGRDVECSGAYIKLLTKTHLLRLSQFSESTPYSVMFGPDKCGTSHRLHLIIRVTDSSNGRNQEIHAPQPVDDLTVYFTDRQPHLYTLQLYQDSRYEIFIDQSLISQGRLLTDEVQYTESPESPVSGLWVGSVAALGLELWSLSGEVMFDNFLLTDDLKLAERWTQDTWGQKQPGLLERLLIATNSHPWLWGVYIFTVGLPITLFISYMWPDKRFGPPDQDYYYKKSDEPQPEKDQPDRPTSLSDYDVLYVCVGAMSREGARRRETQKVQRKSDLEVENE